jgi:hypothetical protein
MHLTQTGDTIWVGRYSHRANSPALRMVRMFLRRNELRRSSDRVEAVVVAALMAVFVAAIIVAAFLATRVYRSEQATSASLRPTVAVLSWPGAVAETPILHEATAMATWRLSDGTARSGLLTTAVAPGIFGQPAGASIRLWLDRSGAPSAPPQGAGGMAIGATMAGLAIVVASASLLTFCYRLCQRGLDRRRLANWSSDWAVTGPQWTSRQ